MQILPEWAPNIHPMFVHFPIALLILAIFVDLLSVIIKKHVWIRYSSLMLYGFGTLATLVTYISGDQAEDMVHLPHEAIPVLNEHADLALMVLLFFAVFTVLRAYSIWKAGKRYNLVSVVLLICTIPGFYLIFETGEHGAELVFKYGVGIQKTEKLSGAENMGSRMNKPEGLSGIREQKDGSWQWIPAGDYESVLKHDVHWFSGDIDSVNVELINAASDSQFLKIKLNRNTIFITRGQKLKSVAADLYINTDNFEGTTRLLHHIRDKQNYDFVELEAGKIKVGRCSENKIQIFDETPVTYHGLIKLGVVADGTHFRGYINDKLYAHGHGSEPAPGTVGIFVNGTGTVLIDKIDVNALAE